MQPQTLLFFGQVGSGKGTQAKLLMDFFKNKYGLESVYVCPGIEYRKLIASGSYTGKIVKDSVEKGNIQPGFLTDSIVMNILISSLTLKNNLITDGYPREIEQSMSFEKIAKLYNRKNIKIIYIEVNKEEAMKRNLLRGRTDDTKEGIEKRFDEYVNKVVPAMNYFKDKNDYTICKINGEQSVENVHQDIIKVLGNL